MGIIQEYNIGKIMQVKIPVLIAAGLSLLLTVCCGFQASKTKVFLWASGFQAFWYLTLFFTPGGIRDE